MMRKTNLLKAYTTATEVKNIDLPVNPLSHLVLSMDGYNVTDEATLAELLAFINKIEVVRGGASVLSLESEDLAALNCYLFRGHPILTQNVATDNAFRQLSLIIPFGRKLYNPLECLPATTKGELTLKLDMTVPSASLDNSTLQLDAVELIGATPTQHLKAVQKNVVAPGATGEHDITLPIGNKIIALLVWLTTFPATSSHDYGVNGWRLRMNNIEKAIHYITTQGAIGEMAYRLQTFPRDIAAFGDILPDNFLWLDFDPNGDSQELIDSVGASEFTLVGNYAVNEALKLTPIELVATTTGT